MLSTLIVVVIAFSPRFQLIKV